jgi:hypothetical protein
MPFTNFSDQGSTLSPGERSAEATRILQRLKSCDLSGQSERAQEFVEEMLSDLDFLGSVGVTVKQLYWLRDIIMRRLTNP